VKPLDDSDDDQQGADEDHRRQSKKGSGTGGDHTERQEQYSQPQY
jgi:hypothetical protein